MSVCWLCMCVCVCVRARMRTCMLFSSCTSWCLCLRICVHVCMCVCVCISRVHVVVGDDYPHFGMRFLECIENRLSQPTCIHDCVRLWLRLLQYRVGSSLCMPTRMKRNISLHVVLCDDNYTSWPCVCCDWAGRHTFFFTV
jgi:hypothetical protein